MTYIIGFYIKSGVDKMPKPYVRNAPIFSKISAQKPYIKCTEMF